MNERPDSILDRLAQEARIMHKARMLPQSGPLKPEQTEQVRQDFIAFTRENNISHKTVSRALGGGFSKSTISLWLSGKYDGDVDRVTRAINQWMEDEAVARAFRRPDGFVETEVVTKMLAAMKMARTQGTMALIHGPAGVGKTMTAEAAATVFQGSIYVRVMQATRRGPGLIAEIATLLGLSTRNSGWRVQKSVIDELKGTNRMLIIDEVHQLHEKGYEAVRDLHDAAGIPIILIGTVDACKHVTDITQHFGQFSSRIAVRCDITEEALRPNSPKPLFSLDEVMRVFDGGKVRLSRDGGRYLQMIANVPGLGGLRICDRIMRVVYSITSLHGQSVGVDVLSDVFQQMHGEAFTKLVKDRTSRKEQPRQVAAA